MDGDRYSRQERFAPIGPDGQARLRAAKALVVGCGALGSAIADMLARAGVGALRLVDRDRVEWSNLPRQSLYTEAHARRSVPKVEAAAEALRAIDGQMVLDVRHLNLDEGNVADCLSGMDLALDGCDNFATRHVVNAACCRAGLPYCYGGVVAAYGCSMPVVPGRTPCLRCLQDRLPAPDEQPTCHSHGVIAPAVHLVAAWEVTDALRYLVGGPSAVQPVFRSADLWEDRYQRVDVARWRDPACPVCRHLERSGRQELSDTKRWR